MNSKLQPVIDWAKEREWVYDKDYAECFTADERTSEITNWRMIELYNDYIDGQIKIIDEVIEQFGGCYGDEEVVEGWSKYKNELEARKIRYGD